MFELPFYIIVGYNRKIDLNKTYTKKNKNNGFESGANNRES